MHTTKLAENTLGLVIISRFKCSQNITFFLTLSRPVPSRFRPVPFANTAVTTFNFKKEEFRNYESIALNSR